MVFCDIHFMYLLPMESSLKFVVNLQINIYVAMMS